MKAKIPAIIAGILAIVCLVFAFIMHAKVSSLDVPHTLYCDCGENCIFCKYFCDGEHCNCRLAYMAIIFIAVLLIAALAIIVLRTIQKRDYAKEENDEYLKKFAALKEENERITKERHDLEAKINGESGYEDIVFQLAKSGDTEGNGSLIVELMNNEKDKNVKTDVSLEVQPPKEKEEQ